MESVLSYTQAQWDIVLACFVLAAFALIATFVYLLSTRREISARYRPSGTAGAIIGLVAALAYLLLITSWIKGFTYQPGSHTYTPSDSALQFRNAYRYVDWAITVPLLSLELLVVSTLSGLRAKRTRFVFMALAFLMIATGFLGADTFNSTGGRLLWGLISTVLFIPLYIGVLKTGFSSAKELGEPAGPHIKGAVLMLSWTWGVYPIAYCVPFFFADSPGWAVGRQIAFTLADIAAKVGFGFFIHSCAKARTAVDVAQAETPHPEPVYIDTEKVAEAQPVLVSARTSASFGHPYDGVDGDVHTAARSGLLGGSDVDGAGQEADPTRRSR